MAKRVHTNNLQTSTLRLYVEDACMECFRHSNKAKMQKTVLIGGSGKKEVFWNPEPPLDWFAVWSLLFRFFGLHFYQSFIPETNVDIILRHWFCFYFCSLSPDMPHLKKTECAGVVLTGAAILIILDAYFISSLKITKDLLLSFLTWDSDACRFSNSPGSL